MSPHPEGGAGDRAERIMTPRTLRQDPGKRPKGSERFLLRVFIITLIPVTLAGATFLFLSVYLFLKGASFLRLKEVKIEGNRRVSSSKILAITDLEDGPNILSLDIKALNHRLGQHPWIEKSMIKRELPDTIYIVIQERSPIALIHLGKLYYVDENGTIFDQAMGRDKPAYPVLTGIRREDLEKGEKKAHLLLEKAIHMLKMTRDGRILPDQSISQIHLDRAVGLLVYTAKKGTEIRMGFDDFERKFQRLSQIWPTIRPMKLRAIDCTIPGKIIVQQKR